MDSEPFDAESDITVKNIMAQIDDENEVIIRSPKSVFVALIFFPLWFSLFATYDTAFEILMAIAIWVSSLIGLASAITFQIRMDSAEISQTGFRVEKKGIAIENIVAIYVNRKQYDTHKLASIFILPSPIHHENKLVMFQGSNDTFKDFLHVLKRRFGELEEGESLRDFEQSRFFQLLKASKLQEADELEDTKFEEMKRLASFEPSLVKLLKAGASQYIMASLLLGMSTVFAFQAQPQLWPPSTTFILLLLATAFSLHLAAFVIGLRIRRPFPLGIFRLPESAMMRLPVVFCTGTSYLVTLMSLTLYLIFTFKDWSVYWQMPFIILVFSGLSIGIIGSVYFLCTLRGVMKHLLHSDIDLESGTLL